MRYLRLSALLLLASATLFAQPGPAQLADATIDAAVRAEVVDAALRALNEAYVFPDVAAKMAAAIRARQQRKEYDAITSGRQFAQILTDHLREVSHDLHLSVSFMQPGPPPAPPPPPGGGALTLEERQRMIAARQNFGFAKVERLAGNIGYVDIRGFMRPAVAGETAAAAMNFLAGSDAVIFDLRQNGGGDPAMVALVTSYLFAQPVHLNDFYNRTTNQTYSSWTVPFVPGRRLTGKDAYILTSARTFSGAEEFTYNLKHLKRATIVGETTGGGAHTVAGRRLTSQFAIGIPSGRPINAVTKTNWEGVGVEPDVKVPADNALKVAHLMALEKQQQALTDAPGLRNEVNAAIESLRAELGALTAAIAKADTVKPVPASGANEDFESGTLANWRTSQSGAGGWFVYTNGKTPPDRARSDPNFVFDVPDPPQGRFAAISDASGPGKRLLYREITLDGRYRLQLSVFYVNVGTFSAVTTSPRNTLSDEQQFRIDIVSASAPLDSMAKEHVLATVFQSQPGDPARRTPAEITADLSPWEGQTVRLRVVSADNQGPLRAGMDDVRFERVR